MSLILDALQRSQEQQLPSSQPVAMTHLAAPKNSRPWGLIIGALLGTGALLLFWQLDAWWVPNASTGSSESAASNAIQEADPPSRVKQPPSIGVEDVTVAVSTAPARQLAEAAVYDKEVSALYESIQTTAATDVSEQPAADQGNPNKQSLVDEQGDPPIDIEALLRKAQTEMGETPLTPNPVPLIDRLSQQQKDRIPTLLYSEHSWSTQSPSVVLNGHRLFPGGRLDGFVVVEILTDSVIVTWGGVEFRLAALNSWVNL